MGRIENIIFLLLAVAVCTAMPLEMADGDSGEGHGDGIDVIYTFSGTEGGLGVLSVSLSSVPTEDVSLYLVSLNDEQTVGPLQAQRMFMVEVRPLLFEEYIVLLQKTNSGETIAECTLVVSGLPVVTYDAAGGSGYTAPSPSDEAGKVILSDSTFTAPEGKSFESWSIEGERYQPGSSVIISENTVATAVWADAVCTVSYDSNGGSGSMPSFTITYGDSFTLPDCGFTAPEDKSFSGWKVYDKDYDTGDTVVIKGDTVIQAQWSSGSDMTMVFVAIAVIVVAIAAILVLILIRRR